MSFGLSEDSALRDYLKGFKVVDEKNTSRDVGVWFANPDVEERTQSYPYITVELMNYTRAGYRQVSGINVDLDKQGTVTATDGSHVYTYEYPVPWDLTYQIVSYARHPRHDRAIIDFLLNQAFPGQRALIPITVDNGAYSLNRHLILEEFTKRDTIEDGRRLFRNVLTVTLSSEGSAFGPAATPVVDNVIINSSTPDLPPDLLPI